METKRQLDVLDRNLATRRYITGDDYSIADMAIFPWYGGLLLQNLYGAAEFLETASYRNVLRWANELAARPAVKRGMRVNRTKEPDAVRERHDAGDLDVPGSAAAT
jgi:GST-like protein